MAWIKPSKKDMAVTFSYSALATWVAEVKPGLAWRIKTHPCHTVECIASMKNIDKDMIKNDGSGLLILCFALLESCVVV